MTPEETAERFSDARPGFDLISYAEVALPFYRLTLRLQTIEHKAIGPFEEFLLRAVDAGIVEQHVIAEALGLEAGVIEAILVGLLESDALLLGPVGTDGKETLVVGVAGRRMLEDAAQIVSDQRVIDVDYDGLLRKPTPFLVRYLEPRQVSRRGIREIAPHPTRPPDEVELRTKLDLIEAIIRETGGPRREMADVLAVRGVQRRTRIFQSAVALVFRPQGTRRAQGQVAFVIAGQLSDPHSRVFAEAGLGRKLGLAKRGIEDARAAASRVLGEDVVNRIQTQTGTVPTTTGTAGALDLAPSDGVRSVETYEHPRILAHALKSSRQRLLIISPWLRSAVIDEAFIAELEDALKRGVSVYIGWGMATSEDAKDADKGAFEQLTSLATKHERFVFKRLGKTNAKVLLCDDAFVVVTSFNWLSFKGDPKRTFRDERGTLVSLSDHVEEQFGELSARFR